MSDYNLYNFTITSVDDLLRTIKEAKEFGVEPMLVVNGMYYNIEIEKGEEK